MVLNGLFNLAQVSAQRCCLYQKPLFIDPSLHFLTVMEKLKELQLTFQGSSPIKR